MNHEDKIARMYKIMARLAEIEYERETILRRRDINTWNWINLNRRQYVTSGRKSWVTRRANLAARKRAA